MNGRELSSGLSADVLELVASEGRTQRQIALMLGVTEGYISRVRSGQRALTLAHVQRLADGLGVPVAALFLRASEMIKIPSGHRGKLYKLIQEALRLGVTAELSARAELAGTPQSELKVRRRKSA